MENSYAVTDSNVTEEWKQVCEAFAKKIDAELLFVNFCSCGIETKDGSLMHIYPEEMEMILREDDPHFKD